MTDPEYQRKELTAQRLIIKHVHPNCSEVLQDKKTAYEMAFALKKIYQQTGLATRNLLRHQLYNCKYDGVKPMHQFLMQFDNLLREYKGAGGRIEDDEAIQILLMNMPEEYDAVVTTLEIQAKNIVLSLESAKSTLVEYETKRRFKSSFSSVNDTAAFNAKKGGQHKKPPPKQDIKQIRCYNCNDRGHKANKCPKPRKPRKDDKKDESTNNSTEHTVHQ